MIHIEKVTEKRDLKAFIAFPSSLYRNDPNWIDPLFIEREEHLSKKNPSVEHIEWQAFLAKKRVRLSGELPRKSTVFTASFMVRIPAISA